MADAIQAKQQSFKEKMKELEKQLKQVPINCPHQYEDRKNKTALKVIPGTAEVKCKRCQEEFSMKKVKTEELMAAVRTLHNAINQIKVCCDPSNEKDMALIEALGKQDFYNLDVVEVYERVTNDYGNKKKNKKKKNKGSSIGYYGNVTF